MAALELYIGKSKYIIDCAEDEKEKIIKLASKLNERVNNLSLKMRGGDEKTILMLSSIMAEAELETLKTSSNPSNQGSAVENTNESNQDLENICFFIENLAYKIEND